LKREREQNAILQQVHDRLLHPVPMKMER